MAVSELVQKVQLWQATCQGSWGTCWKGKNGSGTGWTGGIPVCTNEAGSSSGLEHTGPGDANSRAESRPGAFKRQVTASCPGPPAGRL